MTISKYNSDKIKILSFISILFVLYIHAPYVESVGYPMAQGAQSFMAYYGLALFAVPLFYAISGLLFFNGIQKVGDCLPKIKKRVRSLLIPYIIWNLVFVGWYIVLAYIPGISGFVNSDMMSNLSLSDPFANLCFLFVEPAGFYLWFLRDLIIYVALSPILYICIKRYPCITLLLLAVSLGWVPRIGVVYFSLGGVISVHYSLEQLSTFLHKRRSIVLLCIFLLNAILSIYGIIRPGNAYWQYYITIMSIVAISAVWGGYDLIVSPHFKLSSLMSKLLSYTFFIYLFHEPTFNIIKKLGLKVLGIHEWSLTFLYLVNPIIMVVMAVSVGMLFKRLLPKTYSVCVGGR